jgi:hypothetical protein
MKLNIVHVVSGAHAIWISATVDRVRDQSWICGEILWAVVHLVRTHHTSSPSEVSHPRENIGDFGGDSLRVQQREERQRDTEQQTSETSKKG